MTDAMRRVFELNQIIVSSAIGQVFFVLGLVIAVRLRRESHLPLARSLKWLSAFGFLLALHKWGDVFIPVQARFLAQPFVDVLLMMQASVLGVGFACLFQFGMETLRVGPRARILSVLPTAALALWLAWAFGPAMSSYPTVDEWHRATMIWARYGIGFPGAMFAAIGLRRQAQQLIAPLQMPEIWHTLRVAGLALAGFAVVGGLVVPAADFFPANVLNEEAVFARTAVPIAIYRGALALVLTWAVLRSLDVFREEVDRQIASLHAESALATERERFRRELHDGTLQTVYAAGLLLRSVERSATADRDGTVPLIQRSIDLLDVAVADMRQALGQVQPALPQQGLGEELAALIQTRHLEALVDVTLDVRLSPACGMAASRVAAIATIAGEALSNVVRHARASRVEIRATSTEELVTLLVQDNGRGFDASQGAGSGLRNMRDRARLLGGDLRVVPAPGGGTLVELQVPCAEGPDALRASSSARLSDPNRESAT